MKHPMNLARTVRVVLVNLQLIVPLLTYPQGLNNLWLGGYFGEGPPPVGSVDVDFQTGNAIVTTTNRAIGFGRTNTNITDSEGDLLFSTNGAFVANASGDTMLNGTGLNPSEYTSNYPGGLHLAQPVLIIPKPESGDIYYLLHGTLDDQVAFTAQHLYLTTIDMSLDGGLGGVVTKNEILINDQLNVGKITAVRHANGRDWWVFCHKVNTNMFHRLLVTPSGASVDGTQTIGIDRPPDNGQVCFSPDGSKFAYYWGQDELEVFDFDRCAGTFSDPVFIIVPDANPGSGVAFSPNSRYLYVSSVEDVYQYDTQASDIAATQVHIAHWDGFYSPAPPLATLFDIAQLAPDGKIYIGTGNSTFHLHVINSPDEGGVACDMVQHGLELPRYFINSLPNHPNYHLGPVDGSVCDSLGITVGIQDAELVAHVSAYPNPTTGACTLSYPAQPWVGELEVRDLAGRLVLRERIPQWSQMHRVDLHEAPGMYQCRMNWGARMATTRVVLIE